jgi:hypothetical protein
VLAWQEILDGSATQEESIQFREIQMGSIGGWIIQTEIDNRTVHQGNVGSRQHRGVLLALYKILTDALLR